MFNLNSEELMIYNGGNCFLFENNGTALSIFEGATTTANGAETGMAFDAGKPEGYHASNATAGFERLKALTGIEGQQQPVVVLNMGLDVFRMYLNE